MFLHLTDWALPLTFQLGLLTLSVHRCLSSRAAVLTQSGASSFFIQGGGGGGGIAKDERSFGFKATNHGRKEEGDFSADFVLELPNGNDASDSST